MNKHRFALGVEGFTLLEVILFLAISSALIGIAFFGLRPRLQNTYFSSSMRDLQNSLQNNLSAAQSGENRRQSIGSCAYAGSPQNQIVLGSGSSLQSGAAGDCVSNGTLAIFSEEGGTKNIQYRQIVSLRNPVGGTCSLEGVQATIQCHKATVLDAGHGGATYNYIHGLVQDKTVFSVAGSTRDGTVGFGYIQNPNSTEAYPIIARLNSPLGPGSLADGTEVLQVNPADTLTVCYSLGQRRAKIEFSNRSLKPVVKLNEECT